MWHMHRKISMLVIALLCAGQLSCTQGQLDRATAEKLIRSGNQVGGNAFVLRLISPAWVDGTPSRPDAQRQLNLDFLGVLAKAGVIRWKPEVKVPVGLVNGIYIGGAETVRPFESISQGYVSWHAGGPYNPDVVSVTLAVPDLKQVTGITQQETTAIAEASVGLKPTPIYDRLLPLVTNLLARCSFSTWDFASHNTDPLNMAAPQICKEWLTQEKLASTVVVQFQFTKFDDGWRLSTQ